MGSSNASHPHLTRADVLIIQGGAQRIAWPLGVLIALHLLGVGLPARILSGSSGLLIALFTRGTRYFEAVRFLCETLPRAGVIRPSRLVRILDLDRLVDLLLPLVDLGLGIEAPEIIATTTDVLTGRACFWSLLSRSDVRDLLRASCALSPFHPPVAIEGRPQIDGAFAAGIPLAYALTTGASQARVLLNRPASWRRAAPGPFARAAAPLLYRELGPIARTTVLTRHLRDNAAMELLSAPPSPHSRWLPVCPPEQGAVVPSRFSRSPALLARAVLSGAHTVIEQVCGPSADWPEHVTRAWLQSPALQLARHIREKV